MTPTIPCEEVRTQCEEHAPFPYGTAPLPPGWELEHGTLMYLNAPPFFSYNLRDPVRRMIRECLMKKVGLDG